MLVHGLEPLQVMLHFFARPADPCAGGRQPYAHFGSRELRIVSLQGPQPNHVTHGVGIAWGSRLLGEDSVTWISFGYGAEIAARIADQLFDELDAPVRRVAAMDTFCAYQPQLEDEILPQSSDLVAAVRELLAY